MQTLNQHEINSIHGGNVMIPILAAVGIGACTNILTWSIKNSYQGNTEEFSCWSNYLIEAGVGASISFLGALGFAFAVST